MRSFLYFLARLARLALVVLAVVYIFRLRDPPAPAYTRTWGYCWDPSIWTSPADTPQNPARDRTD
jgi:hypothetical protein